MELTYARCLDWATRFALGVLAAYFALYVFGMLEPLVPVAELPQLWGRPVASFIAATGAPTGWGWLRHVAKGDYLNFVGIAMLGLVTVLCYAFILPALFRSGERLYGALAIAQIVVILAAASGVFALGH